jgi:hypothetical protein
MKKKRMNLTSSKLNFANQDNINSTQEADAEESLVQGQPMLCSKF